MLFFGEQERRAADGRKRCLQHDVGPWSTPSIWDTWEVTDELQQKCRKRGKLPQSATSAGAAGEHEQYPYAELLTMQEYLAMETTKTAANFDGIANAKMTKPKREQHDDAKLQEAPVFKEGCEDTEAGTGQVEGADMRARQAVSYTHLTLPTKA